ncbi:MAG: hypothetical protein GY778_10675 [bacterium]|nr:hypothetical protein [bacterium]
MMGFAWLFINAADDPTVSATVTTRGGGFGTTTTTPSPTATTTTTTLPADVVQYNDAITAAGIAMAGIQQRMVDANADWDASPRNVGYAETLASLQAINAEVTAWRPTIDAIAVPASPPEYANFHASMVAAADAIPTASASIVAGLQAPDTGEARRAALSSFNERVTEYGTQVNTVVAYRPGG